MCLAQSLLLRNDEGAPNYTESSEDTLFDRREHTKSEAAAAEVLDFRIGRGRAYVRSPLLIFMCLRFKVLAG